MKQSSASSFKKQTHSIFSYSLTLSHTNTSPALLLTAPRSKNAKQCYQTATSPTASQGTQARPRTPAAAAALVASSAAASADTTPPQLPSRCMETARRPRPTSRTPSTSRETERPPQAHSQARAVRTHSMTTSTSYSEHSQWLLMSTADQAPQKPRARKA